MFAVCLAALTLVAGVGNAVSGSAFGAKTGTGGEVPVTANWSIQQPGYFKSENQNVHSVTFSSDESGSVQVNAVNACPAGRASC